MPGAPLGDAALDRLVAQAQPLSDEVLQAADLEAGFDLLGDGIMASPPRVSRRRVRRRGAIVLAFAATLGLAAVALGGMYTAHTGFFPSRAGTENDTSEYLRTDAPDFPPLVKSLVKGIPFPPGDSALARVPAYVRQRQPVADGVASTVQAAGIKVTFSMWAICAWRGYWLQEHEARDLEQQTVAAAALASIASSDTVRRWDSFSPIYLGVARSEAAGDPSAPKDFETFYQVNCSGQPQPWATK